MCYTKTTNKRSVFYYNTLIINMRKNISINNSYTFVGILILSLFLSSNALAQEGFGPPSGDQMGPPPGIPANIPSGGQGGPSEAQQKAMEKAQEMQQKGDQMQKQGEEQQLKGLKKGADGMEKALKQFENNFAKLEKGGAVIDPSTREKMSSVRGDIETIKAAQAASDIQNVDQNALQDKLSSLGDEIGGYQKMAGFKKMLASMNRGVVSFEKQMTKLQGQGVTIPTTVADDFDKLKAGLQAINDAKTPQELDNANPDQLGDLMTRVNESRPVLEMTAKWPRILKQADQQLKSFNNQLTKTQTLVTKLQTQGIDVSADFATFQLDVADLKTARDAADALMKDGKSEEAFTKMEDEFFNKLDNAGEHQRVIQNLANLSRFNVEFKRSMASAQKSITSLKKRKIDVTDLQTIYDEALAKGNEISAMIKVKPLDETAVANAMDELESLKQTFLDKTDELSGGQTMPWETKTPAQFQGLSLPKDFNNLVTQTTAALKK